MFLLKKHIAGFIAFVHVVCMLEPIATPSSCTNYVDSGGFSFAPAHAPNTRNISQLVRIIRHHQNTTENRCYVFAKKKTYSRIYRVCMLETISTPSSCTNYVDSGGFSFAPAHAPTTRNISQLVRSIRQHQNTTENIANRTNPAICFCSKNILRDLSHSCMLSACSNPFPIRAHALTTSILGAFH
jgi:hypothetical protein